MLNEIFRNRKIFNKYIKNFDLDAVELVGTGMTSVEALKAVVTTIVLHFTPIAMLVYLYCIIIGHLK